MGERVAIVMINYNSWQHTLNCLHSIGERVNPLSDVKIYLIDNASRDDSCARIRAFLAGQPELPVEFLANQENLGFSGGNNVGTRRALSDGCDYVVLLNNDTFLQGDLCAALRRFFHDYPACTVIAAHTRRTDGERELNCTRRRPGFSDLLFLYHTPFWNRPWFPGYRRHYMLEEDLRRPFPVYAGSGACLIFRRSYFDRAGLFDERIFLFAEEFIIGEQCQRHGLQTLFMPEPVVLHLAGQSTKAVSAFSFIEYCRSEKYLAASYYGYGRLRLLALALVRTLKYLYRLPGSADYRANLGRFVRVYGADA